MGTSAVIGIDEFRTHMHGAEGSYPLIGGIACDILLSDVGLPFRATNDFDTVVFADADLPTAARAIWSLVEDGGYRSCHAGRRESCLYRFKDPESPGFPRMIEVFSRKPDFLANRDVVTAPIHIDDEVSSLSAIVLDDDYYALLRRGTAIVDGLSILRPEYLIPFKAKAHLDLKARREAGEAIDSHKVNKHRLDVFRLAQLISSEDFAPLPDSVKLDMERFIAQCNDKPVNLKQIGVSVGSVEEILETLQDVYLR